jgi:hypothetical protein
VSFTLTIGPVGQFRPATVKGTPISTYQVEVARKKGLVELEGRTLRLLRPEALAEIAQGA